MCNSKYNLDLFKQIYRKPAVKLVKKYLMQLCSSKSIYFFQNCQNKIITKFIIHNNS